MRYVRHFDQAWYNELLDDFQRVFEELFYKLSLYNGNINRIQSVLEPTPVQGSKGIMHPFPLAEKVFEIYQWLIGNRKTPPKHTEETMHDLINLYMFNPLIDFSEESIDIDYERWKGMYTGSFYYAVEISLRLYKGKPINASELAFLTHISQVAVLKQIKTNKFSAIKEDNSWKIEAKEAKAWIEQYNLNNPFNPTKEKAWILQTNSSEEKMA